MDEFCKKLPKMELHAHLNGSLSTETLRRLGALDAGVEEYQRLTTIVAKSTRTLDECFTLFNVAHRATSTRAGLRAATIDVIQEFAADNCIYLELRTTPRATTDMNKREYIATVIDAIRSAAADAVNTGVIQVKLLLSIDRRHSQEESQYALDLIVEAHRAHPDIVVGIDLCGNPNEGTFPEDMFHKARDAGLKTSLHCAEVKNDAEARAQLQFKPDRIGHGTCLHPSYGGNLELWKQCLTAKIPLECCLTSNVICGTATSYDSHHFQEWLKSSLPFTLSTDDKGVFCTTLSREYLLAHKYFKLTGMDLWQIADRSIDYAFATDKEKLALHTQMAKWKQDNLQ